MHCRRYRSSPLSRRQMLSQFANGFGAVALSALLQDKTFASSTSGINPLAPKTPHFPAKAKNVIFLYMDGGPSQVDTFDYKPQTGNKKHPGSVAKFSQHGESGLWISEGETGVTGDHNEVGTIPGQNEETIWAALMKRLLEIDGYRTLFREAYPDIAADQLHFAQAANAIAAFEIDAFTFDDSPWDRFLAGDDRALDERQFAGARLFYGKAGCVTCHPGKLMTDQLAHNIGVIPIGPGPDPREDADYGIAHRSNAGLDQKYAFRTPPLRNVELTGPYMHNGAYRSLEAAIRHQLDPVGSLENYDRTQLEPEFRGAVHDEPKILKDVKRTLSPLMKSPPALTDAEVADLVAFLKSLTSPSARDLRRFIPESVPSGLTMVAPIPETD
ncbi:MAG: DUF1501 domain-containing protein [Verrucomicrobiae bacterium]|nr:DUF1501 domain-containing protein [Verrucomicrobiae bacterium]